MALSIAENLVDVRKRLKRAARKAGRDISEITLIAVTKTIEVKRVKEAIKEGLRVFGESYMQEAQEKIKKIGDQKKKWHFVGHLQKNKAKFAVELFDCIHSVDTPGLAREINRRATNPIDILIQVNISGEKTKHGATPEDAIKIAHLMPTLKKLNFRGLMAIPPIFDTPERSRPYFITLRRLAERINRERIPGVVVHDLSIGMSADFDVAIEEGATMVRIGTALFGAREVAGQKVAAKKAVEAEKPASTTKKAGKKKEAKPLIKEKEKAPLKKKPVVTKAASPKKPTAPVKKATVAAKKPASTAKKAVPVKKTASKGRAAETTAPKARSASLKKPAAKKTKAPETVKKAAVTKKPGLTSKKKAAASAVAKKKAPKAAASTAAKKPGAKKPKKPAASKKPS